MALRDQPHFLSELYGLSAASRAELVEQTTRMGLDGVFTHEEFVRDLAVAHALCDQFQDFEFATRDAEIFQALFVQAERQGSGYEHFLDDQDLLLFGDFETEPDTECGEDEGDESTIDLDRVFDDEKLKLDQPEQDDHDPAAETVDEHMYERLSLHVKSDFTPIRVLRG